jgi:hypothetical protein
MTRPRAGSAQIRRQYPVLSRLTPFLITGGYPHCDLFQ